MSGIKIYNIKREEYEGVNVFYIGRPSILGNPYTHIKDRKTKAMYICKDRDEAIEKYSNYFDVMYNSNIEFKNTIDEIYYLYKNGVDVYLGCFCNVDKGEKCHGQIIENKLRKRLIKEKLNVKKK